MATRLVPYARDFQREREYATQKIGCNYIARVLVHTKEEEKARGVICFMRGYAQNKLGELPGVHFVLSCITGTTTNSHGAQANPGRPPVRIGIAFVVNYSPNPMCDDDILTAYLTNMGFDVATEVKLMPQRKGNGASAVINALKDHNSRFAKDMVAHSLRHIASIEPEAAYCTSPCMVVITDPALEADLRLTFQKLVEDGLVCAVGTHVGKRVAAIVPQSAKPMSGPEEALFAVTQCMLQKGLALKAGYMYAQPEGAIVTFRQFCPVDDFIHKCLGVDGITSPLLGHYDRVKAVLSHKSCTVFPQIEVDHNLIKVDDGWVWNIMEMGFQPVDKEKIGKSTPREFVHHDRLTIPQAHHFEELVANSFPNLQEQVHFLVKWYQLLMYRKLPLKTLKLIVWGPTNCGKTSLLNPILAFIPHQNVATLTKEGRFSLAMVNRTTELTFVDEFEAGNLSAEQAKQVLQGGLLFTEKKHKTESESTFNWSAMYLASNHEPNWPNPGDTEVIKERLEVFQMRELPIRKLSVNTWLSKPENALMCVLWAGMSVRRHWDLVPEKEKFFRTGETQNAGNEEFIRKTTEQLCATGQPSVLKRKMMTVQEVFSPDPRPDSDGEWQGKEQTQTQEEIPDETTEPPTKRMTNDSQNIDFSHLRPIDCVADVVDTRENPIDEVDGCNAYHGLIKEQLTNLLEMTLSELRQSYRNYILHRDNLHQETINRLVHNADLDMAGKEAMRKELKEKMVYCDLDCVYDAYGLVTGVCRPSFNVAPFLLRFPSARKDVIEIRKRLDYRLKTA